MSLNLNDVRIANKIASVVVMLGLVCIGVAAYGGSRIIHADTAYSLLTDKEDPARVLLSRATGKMMTMAYNAAMVVVFPGDSPEASAAKRAFEEAATEGSADLGAAAAGLPRYAAAIDDIHDQFNANKVKLDHVVELGLKGDNSTANAELEAIDPELHALVAQGADLTNRGLALARQQSADLTEQSRATRRSLLLASIIGVLLCTGGALWMVKAAITRPLDQLRERMGRLAGGDLDIQVDGQNRGDEIGSMAKAVQIFKDNGLKARALEAEATRLRIEGERERSQTEAERRRSAAEQATVVETLAHSLGRLSQGDLTTRIEAQFDGQYQQIKVDFNATSDSLRQAMGAISTAAGGIRSGSEEIAMASNDLSRRTEQQAASLEETAAALQQITTTVKRSAAGATRAANSASGAKIDAERSGSIMKDAVSAMGEIRQSSGQIARIIGVIDEIAFQTNLLALNAGVEAARAGEAGRGFAVVAQEVRALAQRSAEAAKEIKTLIAASSSQVEQGVKLVGDTGQALTGIVLKVAEIDHLLAEIAQSSHEQATGLSEVNVAVNQMDQVTQQNAAMVEEATAASTSLKGEAAELGRLVGRFQLGEAAAPSIPARRAAPARAVLAMSVNT